MFLRHRVIDIEFTTHPAYFVNVRPKPFAHNDVHFCLFTVISY